MRTAELFQFIQERYLIHQRRANGQPKPWTADPVLQKFRFCNAYRELDKVTIWIRENWREPHATDPHLWFAMVVARMINWPATLEQLGYPVPYESARLIKVMKRRRAEGKKCYTGAYMVRCDCQQPGKTKAHYLNAKVFRPLWRNSTAVAPTKHDTLASFHERLMTYYGMGSFIAAQVVADVKNTPGQALAEAKDWWTWAASGPGSKRGLNAVVGRDFNASWKEEDWFSVLQTLHGQLAPLIEEAGMPRMCAQDVQNCLCEFDKMERVLLGEGRPKQLYPGI